ncbi:CaiB/BaiF CoA transferase family protein [Pseudonocardia spinosispora]|uniref:CaiB/BaiF CoA transferase family protein n=1 Tax=Pseudonocardia spinosispora TaxID=103441 RepID=UPI0004045A56|nr:CoA transferase [Pseudonocardia spinosispora]
MTPGPARTGGAPLAGVRVLDLTRALAGPFVTMLLADLGADVIKVEPPEGDITRAQGPFHPSDELHAYGGYFASINRNKRGVVLDLRTEAGRKVVRDLASRSDVLVENFRSGVLDRLGLSYEELSQVNPRLVYAALRGFGDPRTGASPYAARPAYDVVAQAMGGLMAITGQPEGPPTKVGPGVGDILPAAFTTVGILAALRQAEATGRGDFVDVAMYDAVLALCERVVYQHSYLGAVPGREGNEHPLLCPFGLYRVADGWVAVAAPGDRHWELLCKAMDRPDLVTDERLHTNVARVRHRELVRELFEDWSSTRTMSEVERLLAHNVPVAPVNTIDRIVTDPHVLARDMLLELDHPGVAEPLAVAGMPIKFASGKGVPARRAPLFGEHTDAVLAELGYADAEVAALRAQRVVA